MMEKKKMENKKVIIKAAGMIPGYFSRLGPILSPILMDENMLKNLVVYTRQEEVYEVLEDGTEVLLTLDNWDKDNRTVAPKEVIKEEPKVVEPKAQTFAVEEQPKEDEKPQNNQPANKKKNR